MRALATSENKLFSGSYDGTVKVWDTETLQCLKTLAGHAGPVRTLVLSAGHMFSGSYDKTVSFPELLPTVRPDLPCNLLIGLSSELDQPEVKDLSISFQIPGTVFNTNRAEQRVTKSRNSLTTVLKPAISCLQCLQLQTFP